MIIANGWKCSMQSSEELAKKSGQQINNFVINFGVLKSATNFIGRYLNALEKSKRNQEKRFFLNIEKLWVTQSTLRRSIKAENNIISEKYE